jgi:multidrug resistance protein, MATE family
MSFRSDVKDFVTLGWPMFIGSMAGVAQGAVDTIMAGHYSRDDLAGVGLGVGYFVTVYVVQMGTLQALAPIVSGRYGAGDRGRLGDLLTQGMWAAIFMSILCALAIAHPGLWIGFANPSPIVEQKARLFCQLIAPEMLFLGLLRTAQIFSQAVNEAKAPMVASLSMLVLNIFFNWVFVYGKFGMPELGGPGCGLASTVSAAIVVSGYYLYLYRARRFAPFEPLRRFAWPQWSFMKQFFALGLPIGIATFVEVSSFTVMQVFIAPMGSLIASGHTAVGNFSAVAYMLPMALAGASAILISRSIGAGDHTQAQRYARSALLLSFFIAIALMGLVLIARPVIAMGYTSDLEVRKVIVHLLIAIAVYQVFDCAQCVAQGVLRGYKITLPSTVAFVVAMWGVGLVGGWWLAFRGLQFAGFNLAPMGAIGFWWGCVIGLAVVSAILVPFALWVATRALRKSSTTVVPTSSAAPAA